MFTLDSRYAVSSSRADIVQTGIQNTRTVSRSSTAPSELCTHSRSSLSSSRSRRRILGSPSRPPHSPPPRLENTVRSRRLRTNPASLDGSRHSAPIYPQEVDPRGIRCSSREHTRRRETRRGRGQAPESGTWWSLRGINFGISLVPEFRNNLVTALGNSRDK
jgi:hypothetical protein